MVHITGKKISKSTLILSAVVGVLVLTVAAFGYILLTDRAAPPVPAQNNTLPAGDPNVITQMDKAAAEAMLKKQQEEAKLNNIIVAMPSQFKFKDSKTPCKMNLENVPENLRAFTISFVLSGTGEEVMSVGLLKPGESLAEVSLSKELAKGQYTVTALYTTYDLETNEAKGQVGVGVEIVVES